MNRPSLFLVGLLTLVACNQPFEPASAPPQEAKEITFTLSQYQDEILSKTTYTPESSGYCFYWAAGDAVGIVSPAGNQLKFAINPADYGKQYASFDGRGFALMSNTSYSSYYPFLPDFDLDPTALPISYEGQHQIGDNNTQHLGTHSYSVAMGVSPDEGRLDFTFWNVGSPHRYRIPVQPGEFARLTLNIPSAKYTLSGTLNLTATEKTTLLTISPTETTQTLSLNLIGTSLASTGPLRCWMMVPPVNLVGDVIRLTLETTDGSAYVASVAGRDCPANNQRAFNALTSVYPAITEVNSEGGTVQIKVIKTAADNVITPSIGQAWITAIDSSSDGLVTTYNYTVAANEGAAREGTISFTESSTGLVNSVTISQFKAGAVIGIGGWDTDNHSGNAQ